MEGVGEGFGGWHLTAKGKRDRETRGVVVTHNKQDRKGWEGLGIEDGSRDGVAWRWLGGREGVDGGGGCQLPCQEGEILNPVYSAVFKKKKFLSATLLAISCPLFMFCSLLCKPEATSASLYLFCSLSLSLAHPISIRDFGGGSGDDGGVADLGVKLK